jgi:hypothetical protein
VYRFNSSLPSAILPFTTSQEDSQHVVGPPIRWFGACNLWMANGVQTQRNFSKCCAVSGIIRDLNPYGTYKSTLTKESLHATAWSQSPLRPPSSSVRVGTLCDRPCQAFPSPSGRNVMTTLSSCSGQGAGTWGLASADGVTPRRCMESCWTSWCSTGSRTFPGRPARPAHRQHHRAEHHGRCPARRAAPALSQVPQRLPVGPGGSPLDQPRHHRRFYVLLRAQPHTHADLRADAFLRGQRHAGWSRNTLSCREDANAH